jgi:hypothetical protein
VLNLDVSFLGGGPGLRLVLIAAALILPSALVSGALFTSVGVALARTLEPSRATGLLALFNTAGGAVGAMVAGFGLLPFLGMERSFLILAVLYGLAAAGSPAAWSRLRRSRALILATATFLIFVVLFPLGLMERTYLRRALWPFVKPGSSSQVLAFREGTTETITYVGQMFEGEVVSTRLVTNGFSMSGTFFEGRRYMEAFVYLPVAIHPHVRRALLVSYGVGATARALSQTPEIEHIDVVDISSDILDLAPMAFPPPEVSPLSDPRVITHVEDGRFFLHTATEPYDLITSEPPPPHLGGVVNLYTQEYFALVRRHLNPGGVVSYWLPVASLSDEDARAISSAFCEVFDDCTLWKGMNLDWILIGTNGMKTAVSAERFRAQWAPGGPADLRSLGFEEPEQLGALFMGDRRSIQDLASAKPLTDNYPGRLSRTPPPTPPFGEWRRRLMDSAACRQRFEASDFIRAVWPEDIRSATLPYFAIQGVYDEMVETLLGRRGSNTSADAVRLMRETPLQVLPAILLGSSPDLQILAKRVAGRGGVEAAWFHAHQAVVDLTARRFSPAIDHFRSALRIDPSFPGLTERLTLALCMGGRVSEANAEQHRAGLDGEWSAILQSACAPGSTRPGPDERARTEQEPSR